MKVDERVGGVEVPLDRDVMLDGMKDGDMVNTRGLVEAVQKSVGGKLGEGVIDDPGDQL